MTLNDDLLGARNKIVELSASIVAKHEEGFYKALRQAAVLLKVDKPFDIGFDLEKDVYGGELVYIGPPTGPEDARADVGPRTTVDVAAEIEERVGGKAEE